MIMREQKTKIREKNIFKTFNPFRLISNDEYNTNLNAIIAYYQISKGETKRRFIGS